MANRIKWSTESTNSEINGYFENNYCVQINSYFQKREFGYDPIKIFTVKLSAIFLYSSGIPESMLASCSTRSATYALESAMNEGERLLDEILKIQKGLDIYGE